jgi:hypothetical protein
VLYKDKKRALESFRIWEVQGRNDTFSSLKLWYD